MYTITEKERQIPVKGEYDVFVAGGGVAGISAALAAARNGARVVLAEKQCMLGGLATAGLVTIYLPLCDGCGRQVSFGQAEELLKLSIKHFAEKNYPTAWLENGTHEEKSRKRYEVQFNAALLAIESEKLLAEAGVKILYDTKICGVVAENDKITSIAVENKSGRTAYKIKSVVDATGDADICSFAGENTETFKPMNVLAAWSYAYSKGKVDLNMLGYAEVPDEDKTGSEPQPLTDRRFTGLDGEEISDMLIMSHTQILNDFIKKRKSDDTYMPVTIATMPQLRMTRRIGGKYVLDDSEMHKYFGSSCGLISDWRKRGPVYEIPFETLYGEKVKNLICAGRCISVTDTMWDISRVIPACAVTGQAAGTAAAMSDDFAELDVSKLQDILKNSGVVLHEKDLV